VPLSDELLSICSVTVKSAITPSFIGRMARCCRELFPSICFASLPTAGSSSSRSAGFLADRHHRRFVETIPLPRT